MAFEPNFHHSQAVDAALARSAATGRKVLVEYGGDWCVWSRRMESVLNKYDIASCIAEHFVFLRIYVGPDGAWIPSRIELPAMRSVPFFSLVSDSGKVLQNQATEPFEFLWFYRKSAILRLLERWARI